MYFSLIIPICNPEVNPSDLSASFPTPRRTGVTSHRQMRFLILCIQNIIESSIKPTQYVMFTSVDKLLFSKQKINNDTRNVCVGSLGVCCEGWRARLRVSVSPLTVTFIGNMGDGHLSCPAFDYVWTTCTKYYWCLLSSNLPYMKNITCLKTLNLVYVGSIKILRFFFFVFENTFLSIKSVFNSHWPCIRTKQQYLWFNQNDWLKTNVEECCCLKEHRHYYQCNVSVSFILWSLKKNLPLCQIIRPNDNGTL
jgi:hypothetical protein